MSQEEMLAHIESKLAVLDRPMALMRWLVVGGFFIGAWATAQQMTLASLLEWKVDKTRHDQQQDSDIRILERDVLSKLHGVSTRIGQAKNALVQEINRPTPNE
jgi:hypothetical protein